MYEDDPTKPLSWVKLERFIQLISSENEISKITQFIICTWELKKFVRKNLHNLKVSWQETIKYGNRKKYTIKTCLKGIIKGGVEV